MPPLRSNRSSVPLFVVGMFISGCANSLLSKYQDMQCVGNCDPDSPEVRQDFEQPIWQSLNMFIGETMCFLPILYQYFRDKHNASKSEYKIVPPTPRETTPLSALSRKPLRPVPPPLQGAAMLWFWFPALLDICGTSLINVGLILTPVSVYQMSRGALVLWVGLLSVFILKRKLSGYQWMSLVVVMSGVAIVGLSGSLVKSAADSGDGVVGELTKRMFGSKHPGSEASREDPAKVFIGVLFILFAQVFTACQFVMEEKIMTWYTVEPLKAVGLEGFFGFTTILLMMPFLNLFASYSTYFDIPLGFRQIINNPMVIILSGVICLSISMFNVCGLSVTRAVSAASRSTIDTCRTVGIWGVSLALGWEHLVWPISLLQISGFILLVYGTFVFNGLLDPLIWPTASQILIRSYYREDDLERTAALPASLEQGRPGYDVLPSQGEHGRR